LSSVIFFSSALRNQADQEAVVCFVSDPSLIEKLEPYPAEVDAIFTHPLKGVLEEKVDGEDAAGLSEKGGEWWPFAEEFHVRFPRICCTDSSPSRIEQG